MPKLSVITLVYNQAPFLEERIRSIIKQTFQDFEWIIIDDCSTDNSMEIIRKKLAGVPQVKCLIVHKQNCGVHPSFNEALSHCTAKYVHHAAGDDSCDPELFAKSVTFMETNDDLGFIHTAYRIIDENNRVNRVIYPMKDISISLSYDFFKKLALDGNFVCSPSVTFHRERYQSIGGMSNDWVYASDYELWMRLSMRWNVGYIAEPLVSWRRHPQALSRRVQVHPEGASETYRVLSKVFSTSELPTEIKDVDKLYRNAIRNISTSKMVALSLWWLFYMRKPIMSLKMLKEAHLYDPGVWTNPFTYKNIIRYIIPLAIRRLVKGQGGDLDSLPRTF